jgi:type IV pilus assembly protein PilB
MDLRKTKKKLGNILVEQGIITEEQLDAALKKQKTHHQRLGELLVDLRFTDELAIAKALRQQLGLEYVMLAGYYIESKIVNLVNEQLLRKHMLIPFEFSRRDPDTLRVAMADPLDLNAIDDLAIVTEYKIEPVIAIPREISALIDRYYGNAEAIAVAERYSQEKEKQTREKEEQLQVIEEINQSPIVLLVKTTIEQAVRQRASDIHIEPLEKQIRIRYRIDGALYEIIRYELHLLPAIVTRIKIISGLDISEKRNPQDGRITMVVDRMDYDIRVSILPTVFGEKVVMRLTSMRSMARTKKDLGFSETELVKFDAIMEKPHGIILVTGPTGSGKSTTLYTVLSELNQTDVNIITVEDPVESTIEGINQVQVNTKAKLTFAAALRSILRQDPNIIMIGEIRDSETAEIAVRASITGHLVVSTLHTNSAASSITRLEDMGIESYLLADSLVGVIAQRLIRKLCTCCRKERMAEPLEKELLGLELSAEQVLYEPGGCPMCNQTGYFGRTGVYEILPVTPAIREAISRRCNSVQLSELAIREGMSTLKMSAVKYVLEGITSISEMKKISLGDSVKMDDDFHTSKFEPA